jgi:ClpP class serine protease
MLMDATTRKAIEAAGWKIRDAAHFLGMIVKEHQLLDARMELARAIRWQRQSVNMTQKQLGENNQRPHLVLAPLRASVAP